MDETTTWLNEESQRVNEDPLHLIEQESSIPIYYLSEAERMEWIKRFKPFYRSFLPSMDENE